MRPSVNASDALAALRQRGDAATASFLQGFFKTGPGEYGEGDRFLGIRVPEVRRLARDFRDLPIEELDRLLQSEWHEARLMALVLLVRAYDRGDGAVRQRVYDLYLARLAHVNNWDLVDASAPHIVGRHLETRQRGPLARLARGATVWERRVAIVATLHLIRTGDFGETLGIAEMLLDDPHDLIHKATGWMLREVGKREQSVLEGFLTRHYPRMPRTMLRYAIERLPPERRRAYLTGTA
jgi:3-methyladenine DNA glycosylase AlkD